MDIDFSIPTRIIMEGDVLANRMPYLKDYGDQVLLVTQKEAFQGTSLEEEVTVLLADYDINVVTYDRIKGVPTVGDIEAGAALAREAGVDFVFALGDEPIIDTGKAIALLAAAEIGSQTLVESPGQRSLPFVCFPTNAGTGTEVTASITMTHRHEDGDRIIHVVNPLLAPNLALLDASYTLDLSSQDTLAHLVKVVAMAMDALISDEANPMTDSLVLSAIGMIDGFFDRLMRKETLTLWDREACMLAGAQVGMAFQEGKGMVTCLGTAISLLRITRPGFAYGVALHGLLPYIDDQAGFATDILCNALDKHGVKDLSAYLQHLLPPFPPLTRAEQDQIMAQFRLQDFKTVLRLSEEDLARILAGLGIEEE